MQQLPLESATLFVSESEWLALHLWLTNQKAAVNKAREKREKYKAWYGKEVPATAMMNLKARRLRSSKYSNGKKPGLNSLLAVVNGERMKALQIYLTEAYRVLASGQC